ncbi:MAG: TetR/AcrR family transcriptional regulator [Deltaproteobacteria bacterium]|nr:MAG: TetR/AcrR family transcriptional regulator [Deltaproteobacteria bacterium]
MSNPGCKEKQGVTIDRILVAALEVFSESGLEGARIDEIAKRAGVNKAMLYYHIGGKEALYSEVIHQIVHHAAESIAKNIIETAAPEEKLMTYIRNIAGIVKENPKIPKLILRELISGGKNYTEPAIQDIIRILKIVSGILQEGEKKGVFIETIPVIIHMMTLGVFGFLSISGPLRARFAFPKEIKMPNSQVAVEEFEKLVLRSIQQESTEQKLLNP